MVSLQHDVPDIRWRAKEVLAAVAGEGFEDRLDALLASPDPRVRGLACYLATKLRGENGVAAVAAHLDSPVVLERYHAIAAPSESGAPEGTAALKQHRERESDPHLRESLDSYFQEASSEGLSTEEEPSKDLE